MNPNTDSNQNNILISSNNKLHTFANLIIYTLIFILISLLSYNIFIIYKNYSIHTPPRNSINVSPEIPDKPHNVFIEN